MKRRRQLISSGPTPTDWMVEVKEHSVRRRDVYVDKGWGLNSMTTVKSTVEKVMTDGRGGPKRLKKG